MSRRVSQQELVACFIEDNSASVLRDQNNNYLGENFEGFIITKFDGTTITV
jgi:hypothetical protein